jgi:hypothetical protein|tara:strand:+ start:275 stop:544 length:270 start_codon:yes stop_codon:yes gene_type:complete
MGGGIVFVWAVHHDSRRGDAQFEIHLNEKEQRPRWAGRALYPADNSWPLKVGVSAAWFSGKVAEKPGNGLRMIANERQAAVGQRPPLFP